MVVTTEGARAPKMEIIPFHGAKLEAARVEETVWVSVRRMCEALGLSFAGQHDKLADVGRAPWATVRVTRMVADDGKEREVFCLDLESVPMWLATIDTSRVAEHVRPKVVLFQREAAKVLRDHFFPAGPRFEVPTSLHAALRLAADLEEERASLRGRVAELAPKAAAHDALENAEGSIPIGDVAKMLAVGRNRLFAWLRDEEILMPGNIPYQRHIDAGHFRVALRRYTTPSGEERTAHTTYATPKGAAYVAKRFVGHRAELAATGDEDADDIVEAAQAERTSYDPSLVTVVVDGVALAAREAC